MPSSPGRGVLRLLLAHYTGMPPAALRFVYGTNGKPRQEGESGVEFNVSHTAGVALFAFAVSRRVGVDVERHRPIAEANEIAEQHFTPRDRELLAAVSIADRDAWFLRLWTAKEAYAKALGAGLSRPLSGLDCIADDVTASGWHIRRLPPYDDYLAAVAFEEPDAAIGSVKTISRIYVQY
jgi:4'-phosphopantetheinyl transferase